MKLALIGSIRDELLNGEELALWLIDLLKKRYPGALQERYQAGEEENSGAILEMVARQRGCLLKGDELDLTKAAGLLLDDFRSGRLGRITLEMPEENKERETTEER